MARDRTAARSRERSEAASLRKLNEAARVLRRSANSPWFRERLEKALPDVYQGLKEIAECEDEAASVFFLDLRSLKSEVGFRLLRDGGVRLACFCRKLEGGFRPWPDCGERLTCLCRKVEGGFRSWRDCRERRTCFCRNDEGGFRLGRGARPTRSGATDET